MTPPFLQPRRLRRLRLLASGIALALVSISSMAQRPPPSLFKCEEGGVVRYSDAPCQDGVKLNLGRTRDPATAQPPASQAAPSLQLSPRRKGLTEEHLRQWRETLEERASAVFEPREPRVSAESRRRVLELERELKRKDKALAETAALLVLQGKMQALWADEDAPTRQSSDEPSSPASRKPKKRGRH